MAKSERQLDDAEFENEARRIARLLWPTAEFGGALVVDQRERDGVFETEECVHLLEATTSKTKDKATRDVGKLVGLAASLRRRSLTKPVQCWFVTMHEPTPEQREVAYKHKGLVNAVSITQFQSRLIDAPSYLNARNNYPFGSIRDPGTGKGQPPTEYVQLDIAQLGTGTLWSVEEIVERASDGGRLTLLGDYGAGKSMTLREVFRGLRKAYFRDRQRQFPIYINLRDHQGQSNPAEVLERHGRNIGFASPSHLVRAWRAGYVVLLLDGFDEVALLGIQGAWRKLRASRYRAMQAVREFIRQSLPGTGLILAGRAHFFDSEKERRAALALDDSCIELSLNDFTDAQIQEYLSGSGFSGGVPSWVPSRPLLVGYLVSRGLLREVASRARDVSGDIVDPAVGWNILVDSVAEREAEIEAGIDGLTVRRILERLATKARSSPGGLGPISVDQIVDAFKEVCGYPPDEQAMVLLQRLPGLGVDPSGDESRSFIDEDFVDVCRAGDIAAFVDDPYNFPVEVFRDAECVGGTLAVRVTVDRIAQRGYPPGKVGAAIRRAAQMDDNGLLSVDVVRVAAARGDTIETPVYVKDLLIPTLDLSDENGDCSRVTFQDCYFTKMEIDGDVSPSRLPRFVRCFVAEVDGRVSVGDLPPGVFDSECVFDGFAQGVETTNEILDLGIPPGAKVLLTILKKLYRQRGAGRKENALTRGLDHRLRRLVPDVLRLMQREGVVIPYKRRDAMIWLPDRRQTVRAARLIAAAPVASSDPLLTRAGQLS